MVAPCIVGAISSFAIIAIAYFTGEIPSGTQVATVIDHE
jgi:hypothetical protein